jgi:hypothetical protein
LRAIISIGLLALLSAPVSAADAHTSAVLTPMRPGEAYARPAPMTKHLAWHKALNEFQRDFEATTAALSQRPDPVVTGSITRPE